MSEPSLFGSLMLATATAMKLLVFLWAWFCLKPWLLRQVDKLLYWTFGSGDDDYCGESDDLGGSADNLLSHGSK